MNWYAPIYRDSLLFNSPMYRRERRRFVGWLLQRIRVGGALPERLRFLDVGCGTGDALELLRDAGCRDLTGLDLAEGMLDQARRRLGAEVRLVRGIIERDPFAAERFDVIVAVLTVHHLHDPRAFFRAADRLLAPGGRLFLLEYNGGSPAHARMLKRMTQRLVAPLRAIVKWKNRRALARIPDAERWFNPAHELLSWPALQRALPAGYGADRTSHGFFLASFNFALVEERGSDAALIRAIDVLDAFARPLGWGYFQWIAGAKPGGNVRSLSV